MTNHPRRPRPALMLLVPPDGQTLTVPLAFNWRMWLEAYENEPRLVKVALGGQKLLIFNGASAATNERAMVMSGRVGPVIQAKGASVFYGFTALELIELVRATEVQVEGKEQP